MLDYILDLLNLFPSQSESESAQDPLMDAIGHDRAAIKKTFASTAKRWNQAHRAHVAVNVVRRMVTLPSWRATPEPTVEWVRRVLELAVNHSNHSREGDRVESDLQWMDTLMSDTLVMLLVAYNQKELGQLASAVGVRVEAPVHQRTQRQLSTIKQDLDRLLYTLHGDAYAQRLGQPQPETPLEDEWMVKQYPPAVETWLHSPRSWMIWMMLDHGITPGVAISGMLGMSSSPSNIRQVLELKANLCSLLTTKWSSLSAAVADQLWGESQRYGPFVSSLESNERNGQHDQGQDDAMIAQRISTALGCTVGILSLEAVAVYHPRTGTAKRSTQHLLHTFLTHRPETGGGEQRLDPVGKEAWVVRLGEGGRSASYASVRRPEKLLGPACVTRDMIEWPLPTL